MQLSHSLVILLSTSLISASSLLNRQSSSAATTLFKFSGRAWAENIAIRSNGALLVTRMDVPELWTIDPVTKAGSKVTTFTSALGAMGITEVLPDIFAVLTGNFTTSGSNKPGSYQIWKVDFTGSTPTSKSVKLVTDSGMFNGLTTFNNNTVLIGDGLKGAVFQLDMTTGDDSILIQDSTMAPTSTTGFSMGIDGLKYRDGFVYYTNIFGSTFYKIAVDPVTGKASEKATMVASAPSGDDFTFGEDGSAYIAVSGKILKVTSDGKSSTAATVSSGTACAFGRTDKDKNTLYVTQNSGAVVSVALS